MTLISILGLIAGIWFLAVTIPGPNFIVVSQHSVTGSRRSGLFIALGVSTAACVWATASLLGLKAVFDHANWLYETIKMIGGCYLVYIGIKIIIGSFRKSETNAKSSDTFDSPLQSYRKGLLTSFSNPKTAAFFGSVFVATFPPQSPNWFFVATLVIVFTISLFWYSVVAVFFSLPKIKEGYERFRKILDRITGSLLLILGFKLAFSKS